MAAQFTSSFSYSDTNMEILNHFPEMSINDGDNFQGILGFSQDSFLSALPEFPGNLADNFPGFFSNENRSVANSTEPGNLTENDMHKGNKRKSMETLESSSANSSPPASGNGIKRKNISGRGKRMKSSEKEGEKNKEVVHVRAKRGQATDSHSLAERLRRRKINERLKCLQSIVPGCYKKMGMAVMLDEIINYVHSLQSQVEFLSMKLTAASTFPEFNAQRDIMETMQRAKAYEATKIEKVESDGCEGLASTQLAPSDLYFGFYHSYIGSVDRI